MEEDVELRLVLVLSDELSLRILCAESARFRLFGDLLYNRLPVLRHSDDLFELPYVWVEGGERPAVDGRPLGGLPAEKISVND